MKEDTTAYSLWLYSAKFVMLLSTMNIKQQIDLKVVYAETRSSACACLRCWIESDFNSKF